MSKKFQMKMKKMMKTKWLIFALLFGLLGAHIYHIIVPKSEIIEIEKVDTIIVNDTIKHVDTITINKPIPIYSEIVKIDTLYKENGDTVQLFTENKLYKDTLCNQNDSIILESSISGINPRLDWMKADWRKQEIIKTITITNTVKRKGLMITPQLGVGYGLLNKKTDVFLGIGLSYNF